MDKYINKLERRRYKGDFDMNRIGRKFPVRTYTFVQFSNM